MSTAQRNVKVIPAKQIVSSSAAFKPVQRRRVAAYARVSTDSEEQQSSYETQVDYYTNYINGREDWELVEVYTDEGISGTSTKRREGFKKMVDDALSGEIDLIVTKSVSRFARNTVDSLTTIRNLKDVGVEVFFEKENIWTFDGKGELLITIMSSIAQEESRSISENVKWGKRKLIAEGHVSVPYSRLLGYEKGEDGGLVVNQEEAELVRRIYSMFLQGYTTGEIAKVLTEEGHKTPGKKDVWKVNTVRGILQNEKYRGDALLQKSFIADFLTKKQVKNEGQIPQYYVEGDHEAIIEPRVFDAVQRELAKASKSNKLGRKRKGQPLAGMVKCAECGYGYGRRLWHSTDRFRKNVYICGNRYAHDKTCTSSVFLEEHEIYDVFINVMNKLLPRRKTFCAKMSKAMSKALDTKELEEQINRLTQEREAVELLVEKCIDDNARNPQDQGEYAKRYNALVEQHAEIIDSIEEVRTEVNRRIGAIQETDAFIEEIKKAPRLIKEFDEMLWQTLVDYAQVYADGKITIVFKNGMELGVDD